MLNITTKNEFRTNRGTNARKEAACLEDKSGRNGDVSRNEGEAPTKS